MPRDPEKVKARAKRFRERRKIAKYGQLAAGRDMRGRHGQHAAGPQNARWNAAARRLTAHGYIAIRVAPDHPHAWGPSRLKRFKYAYEHVVVMMAHIGRPLAENEVVHHRNEVKTDNRLENLQLTTSSDHQRHHTDQRGRDTLGRFNARELPKVAA